MACLATHMYICINLKLFFLHFIFTHQTKHQLWDVTKERRVRVMRSHTERVGVLTWNSHTLTSGSQDSQIHNHDVRIAKHCIGKYLHHKLEVCGLSWSPDGSRLASGGNDNLACIWNLGAGVMEPINVLTGHQAAVKVCVCIYMRNVFLLYISLDDCSCIQHAYVPKWCNTSSICITA